MELSIFGSSKAVTVTETVFDREYSEALVHQVVTAYLAGARAGTKAQKTRSEVRGGGRKPWRQKGTGRARSGTIRSPIWRGGGRAFAAKPRNFEQKVNKKMYRGAMMAIISQMLREDRLVIVDDFTMDSVKTSDFVAKIKDFDIQKGLIVVDELDENLWLSSRNVTGIWAMDVRSLDPVVLVGSDKVIMTVKAVESLQEWLS
ncbi:MAG: 50S ribosomal protein L4 [bacterium]